MNGSYFRALAEKLELEECWLLCLPISFRSCWQQIPVRTEPVQQYQLVSLDGSSILRTWFNPKCPGLYQFHTAWVPLALVLSSRLVENRPIWNYGGVWGPWQEHGDLVSWDSGGQGTKSCPGISLIPRAQKQFCGDLSSKVIITFAVISVLGLSQNIHTTVSSAWNVK